MQRLAFWFEGLPVHDTMQQVDGIVVFVRFGDRKEILHQAALQVGGVVTAVSPGQEWALGLAAAELGEACRQRRWLLNECPGRAGLEGCACQPCHCEVSLGAVIAKHDEFCSRAGLWRRLPGGETLGRRAELWAAAARMASCCHPRPGWTMGVAPEASCLYVGINQE